MRLQLLYQFDGIIYDKLSHARWACFFNEAGIDFIYQKKIDESVFKLTNIYAEDDLYLIIVDKTMPRSSYIAMLQNYSEVHKCKFLVAPSDPKETALLLIYGLPPEFDPDLTFYTYFTTDHGMTESKGGIKNGQFRLWSGAEDGEINEELIPYCKIANCLNP